MVFVLLVFSLPGTPVYDGVRLFLMVFPLWAVWVGIGAGWLVSRGSSIVPIYSRRAYARRVAGRPSLTDCAGQCPSRLLTARGNARRRLCCSWRSKGLAW